MTQLKVVIATVMVALAVASVVTLPVSQPDETAWSTRDVTTGSDVALGHDVTRGAVNATGRRTWTYYPYPYDSMLGWYTAAVISGLILVFVFCESMERVKHAITDYCDARSHPQWFTFTLLYYDLRVCKLVTPFICTNGYCPLLYFFPPETICSHCFHSIMQNSPLAIFQ